MNPRRVWTSKWTASHDMTLTLTMTPSQLGFVTKYSIKQIFPLGKNMLCLLPLDCIVLIHKLM